MAGTHHFACPHCGAALGSSEVDRIVTCSHCALSSLVDGPRFVPEYQVPPSIDKDQARRALQRLLTADGTPAGLLKQSRLHSAELHFVPFHELTARRVGTVVTRDVERPRQPEWERASLGEGAEMDEPRQSLGEARVRVDTRVLIADVARSTPAIELRGFGLQHVELASLRADPRGLLSPFDRRALSAEGTVHLPTKSADDLVAELQDGSPTTGFAADTEHTEVRVKRIYYPVWKLRYRFRNRLFGAALDGVTGEILLARAPENDRIRVLWLLGTAMIVGLVTGELARALIVSIFSSPEAALAAVSFLGSGFLLLLPLVLALCVFLLGLVAAGWERFRYPAEIVFSGASRESVMIKSLPVSRFEKWQDRIGRVLDGYVERALRK